MLDHDTATALRQQLGQLPELLVLAHLALMPGSTPRAGRVSGGAVEAPLPVRLDVLAAIGPSSLAAAADTGDSPGVAVLAHWARVVIYDRRRANDWTGWFPRGTYMLHPTDWRESAASTAVGYLLLHHEWAIRREYATDYAREIDRLHRRLTRVAGAPIPSEPVRIPCPRCLLLTMRQRDDGHRECANPDCWAVLSQSEYESRAVQAAA